jgi:hypothetical protein
MLCMKARRLVLVVGLLLTLGVPATAAGATPAPIQVRVSLAQQTAVAGRPIDGSVVLTNTSSKTIMVNTCAANGWLQVGLRGHGFSYQPTSLLIGCAPSVRLRPGKNPFRVTVATSYQTCLQPGGHSLTSLPACTAAGPPALPLGTYATTTSIVGLDHLTQAPNRLRVTLRSPHS